MKTTIIKNAQLINEGKIIHGDLLIKGERIEKMASAISTQENCEEIDANGLVLLPGVIDDQVHFREPGMTHKATIGSESAAAVAGGVTSFMEMPNTKPSATTIDLLEDKYAIAAKTSPANYSFYIGATNDNIDVIQSVDYSNVCGIKAFLGSSTGNLLVDDDQALDNLFNQAPALIATHCEDEDRVKQRTQEFLEKYDQNIPISKHPIIRDEKACYLSSSKAIEIATKHNTRLHILHISTEDEISLFRNDIPLEQKRITSEVCVHHLWFDADQYETHGSLIKCNPAIKDKRHKPKLFEALLDNHFDVIATDHAPHTWEEKQHGYSSPSGLPLVQHSLQIMLEFYHQGKISLERIVEKMCHAPAQCFKVKERGYLREGYYADIVLVDLNKEHIVSKNNLLYKCGWSPLEDFAFQSSIQQVYVNGSLSFANDQIQAPLSGKRLQFY